MALSVDIPAEGVTQITKQMQVTSYEHCSAKDSPSIE